MNRTIIMTKHNMRINKAFCKKLQGCIYKVKLSEDEKAFCIMCQWFFLKHGSLLKS